MMSVRHDRINGRVRVGASTCGQRRRESIDFLLQLGDTAVGLLLPLPARRRDDTCSIGLCASLAGPGGMVVTQLTFDFELSACLAGTRSLDVVGIMWIS